MKIEFTEQEGQILVQLLDIAVKASGLGGAQAALMFVTRIQDAARAEKEDKEAPK